MSVSSLLSRIEAAEKRVEALEKQRNDPVNIVKSDLGARSLFTGRFFVTPANYYDLTLQQRADLLGGNVNQLCKSIIFENLACDHDNCDDPTNARYYMVIVQYVAKIDTTTLRNFVHGLRPVNTRLSKKSFNFQLASEETSLRLSGFGHNAICPYGMTQRNIPVIICSRCLEVSPPLLYLGGGRVDVKLLLSTHDIVRSLNATVGLITDLREGNTTGSEES